MRAGNTENSVVAWTAFLATVILLLSGCAGREEASGSDASEVSSVETTSEQPYAGLEERPVKALSDKEVDNLLEGRGAGYALAGELNHYPGPSHVLELADDLGLTAEQEQATQELFSAMQKEAKSLGDELVGLEERLDRSFRDEEIDGEELQRITGEIAAVEGRLRATHLNAHLNLKEILEPEQISAYDSLRGYTGTEPSGEHSSNHQRP